MTISPPSGAARIFAAILNFPLTRILLASAAIVVAVLASRALVSLAALQGHMDDLLSTLAGIAAAGAAYLGYVRLLERRPARELSRACAIIELGAGLAFGMLLFAATIGVLAALGAFHVSGTADPMYMLPAFTSAISAGVYEELVFRGIVFRITEEALGTWVAMLVSAALFGFIHLLNPHANLHGAIAIIFEAGVLLAAAYLVTRRLWFPIGLHTAWNFTQGGIFGVAVSGVPSKGWLQGTLSGPAWLSGGVFGVEGSIVAILLCFGAALAFIGHAARRGHILPRAQARLDSRASTGGSRASDRLESS